jgi:hypothetical protein
MTSFTNSPILPLPLHNDSNILNTFKRLSIIGPPLICRMRLIPLLATLPESGFDGGQWTVTRDIGVQASMLDDCYFSAPRMDSKMPFWSSVANRTFGAVKGSRCSGIFCCTSKVWGCGRPRGEVPGWSKESMRGRRAMLPKSYIFESK